MNLANLPARIAAIFAASAAPGYKNTIPLTQAGIQQPGQASYDVGFSPVNMQPAASGGINPFGQDFNGILNAITAVNQWQCGGGSFPYDATWSSTNGGYPVGACLARADGAGYWFNTVDNNTSNPDTGGAGWVPEWQYGITAVTGLTNANVTLTALQYGKPMITLTGTLTGNVSIIFPAIMKQWLVVNNTTGAFSITCKTSSGTGFVVPSGLASPIYGDGTNINSASAQIGFRNQAVYRLVAGVQQVSVNNTASTTTGATSFIGPASGVVKLRIWAGGASGGAGTGGGVGGGGGGGGYFEGVIAVTPGNIYTVAVGAGGASSSGVGNTGGTSTFGSISATGGTGGTASSSTSVGGSAGAGGGVTGATGGLQYAGYPGSNGIYINANAGFGVGGGSFSSTNTGPLTGSGSNGGAFPGGGGSGGMTTSSGEGADGMVIVEY